MSFIKNSSKLLNSNKKLHNSKCIHDIKIEETTIIVPQKKKEQTKGEKWGQQGNGWIQCYKLKTNLKKTKKIINNLNEMHLEGAEWDRNNKVNNKKQKQY